MRVLAVVTIGHKKMGLEILYIPPGVRRKSIRNALNIPVCVTVIMRLYAFICSI